MAKALVLTMLPNMVLLNANSVLLIHNLFENGILPDKWSKSVIKPIIKNKTNDPRLPLNGQGISLISTMCKLFSMLLNKRLSKVLLGSLFVLLLYVPSQQLWSWRDG